MALVPPESADDVEDPLYRLASKIRVRLCSARFTKAAIIDRPSGSFTRKPENLQEPARTERLLKHLSFVVAALHLSRSFVRVACWFGASSAGTLHFLMHAAHVEVPSPLPSPRSNEAD